jgi:arginine utilization regulatory protein
VQLVDATIEELNNLADYDNVLIIDKNGVIIFYDLADIKIVKTLLNLRVIWYKEIFIC